VNKRIINFFWGVVLIGLGAVFFLRETGVIDFAYFSDLTWASIFGIAGAFFLITYFIKGVDQWGWLFPAMISIGAAIIIGLQNTPVGQVLTGAPMLASLAVPFIAAYVLKPTERQWALIPAWAMTVLTGVVFFESYLGGNLVGTIVLYSIALPFLIVYLTDRNKNWALIPFAALCVVGIIPMLEELLPRRRFEIFLMPLFAVPFIGAYFFSKKNWWALIPAGVFLSTGIALLAETIRLDGTIVAALILGGFGFTFGVLWLLRNVHNTEWAKYPALALFGVAVLVSLLGRQAYYIGPVLLIAGGAAVIVYSLIKKSRDSIEISEE